jgi:hypothetical protein
MDFPEAYNAILGRPCYVKFMVVPIYMYLKLKMPGPHGIIMVFASSHVSYACEQASCKLASAQAVTRELVELRKGTDSQAEMDAPKASSSTFKPIEDTKDVPIDDADPAKHIQIGAALSDKWESALIEFLRANYDIFSWKPTDMPRISMEVVEHSLNI